MAHEHAVHHPLDPVQLPRFFAKKGWRETRQRGRDAFGNRIQIGAAERATLAATRDPGLRFDEDGSRQRIGDDVSAPHS